MSHVAAWASTARPHQWNGTAVLPDRLEPNWAIIFQGAKIRWVGPAAQVPPRWQGSRDTTPPGTRFLAPGLIDVHCHGGGGVSFPDATDLDQVTAAANEHLQHGTTTLVASLVADKIGVMERQAGLLADAAEAEIIAGIHFEGPFLAPSRSGAQTRKHLREAKPEVMLRLLESARGAALSMTIAPERVVTREGREALNVLIAAGAIPSWGHTDAGAEDTETAITWGIDLLHNPTHPGVERATVTHLFNGMRPLHHRETGPIACFLAAAAQGHLVLEMVMDGVHVEPHLFTHVLTLVGRDALILTTDAMAAAGMPDGSYQLGSQAVTVKGGIARLSKADTLAGSTAHLLDCVRICVHQAGVSLVDAIYLASTQGARTFGWSDRGEIRVGAKADLLALDGDLRPAGVVRGGEAV